MLDAFVADSIAVLKEPWNEKSLLRKTYVVAGSVLVFAVVPLGYSYYSFLRFVVCVCLFLFFAETKTRNDIDSSWNIGLAFLAILYNPIFPVHIGVHAIWTMINLATVYFLYRLRLRIETPAAPPEPD